MCFLVPLYSTGSAIADFPKLDRDFVKYIVERFKQSTGRTLPIPPAWQAFVNFQQQPEPFLVGIVDMIINPSKTLEEAMKILNNSDFWRQSIELLKNSLIGRLGMLTFSEHMV